MGWPSKSFIKVVTHRSTIPRWNVKPKTRTLASSIQVPALGTVLPSSFFTADVCSLIAEFLFQQGHIQVKGFPFLDPHVNMVLTKDRLHRGLHYCKSADRRGVQCEFHTPSGDSVVLSYRHYSCVFCKDCCLHAGWNSTYSVTRYPLFSAGHDVGTRIVNIFLSQTPLLCIPFQLQNNVHRTRRTEVLFNCYIKNLQLISKGNVFLH